MFLSKKQAPLTQSSPINMLENPFGDLSSPFDGMKNPFTDIKNPMDDSREKSNEKIKFWQE